MGNWNSGRWHLHQRKTTTDEVLRLDIRVMKRQGMLDDDGFSHTLRWHCEGELLASTGYRLEDSHLILDQEGVEQLISVECTPCHFGGQRHWFHCPRCDRRAELLYRVEGLFLCRCCHNLTYESQNEDRTKRMVRAARKIRRRLGVSSDLSVPIEVKPKGMRRGTFTKLVNLECLASLS